MLVVRGHGNESGIILRIFFGFAFYAVKTGGGNSKTNDSKGTVIPQVSKLQGNLGDSDNSHSSDRYFLTHCLSQVLC